MALPRAFDNSYIHMDKAPKVTQAAGSDGNQVRVHSHASRLLSPVFTDLWNFRVFLFVFITANIF